MSPSREAQTGYAVESVTVLTSRGESAHLSGRSWLVERLLPQVIELARSNLSTIPARSKSANDYVLEILCGVVSHSCAGEQTEQLQLFHRLVHHRALAIYRSHRQLQSAHPSTRLYGPSWPELKRRELRNGDLPADTLHALAEDIYALLIFMFTTLEDEGLQGGRLIQLLVEGYSVSEIAQMVGRGERAISRLFQKIERFFIQTDGYGY